MSVSNFIGILSGSFGSRFNLVSILPSFILFIFLFALIFSWDETPLVIPTLDTLISKINTLDLKESVLIFTAIIIFSVITHPLQTRLVRIFEGYWSKHKLIVLFTNIGVQIQRYKRKELAKKPSKWELREYYPEEKLLLPTSLGNVLKAAENIAGRRYGLNTVAIWPRLYPLVSENLRNILDDQRNQLDVAIRFCAVFVISTISSFIYYICIVYTVSINDFPFNFILSNISINNYPFNLYIIITLAIKYSLWLIIPFVSALLAWLSYKGAISAALVYGKSMQTAFDLHRFDLLKALHLPLPSNLEKEKEDNYDLTDFFLLGHLKNFSYLHSNEDIQDDGSTNTK